MPRTKTASEAQSGSIEAASGSPGLNSSQPQRLYLRRPRGVVETPGGGSVGSIAEYTV